MKTLPCLLTLLAFCQVSLAFEPVLFDAAKGAPEQQGWTKVGGLDARVVTADGHSFLDLNDDSETDGVAFTCPIEAGVATEAGDAGFVFEVRGRIEQSSGPTSQQAEFCLPTARAVLVLAALDNRQSAGLIVKNTPKPVFSYSSDSDFHEWKIVAKPASDGNSLQLSYYTDKQLVANELVPLAGTMPHLSFGATGGNTGSRMGHVLYEKVVLRPVESTD